MAQDFHAHFVSEHLNTSDIGQLAGKAHVKAAGILGAVASAVWAYRPAADRVSDERDVLNVQNRIWPPGDAAPPRWWRHSW